jgi:C4-dicarboxylate-specific signal transduction histidine kinase
VQSIEDLKSEIAAREEAEGELRELTGGLEEQVRFRAEELEQRNRQLAEAMSELTQLNRIAMAGELSAAIAHEVNQPLTGMVLRASAAMRWLRAEKPDLDKVRALLSEVVDGGHHASDVVVSVRAMFRKDTQEKSEIDINKVIRSVLGLMYVDLRKHSIEIHPNLSERLPPVIGHEVQLQQVILNLVTNAIESMRSSELRVLSIESELSEQNRVHVSIEDSGSGIERTHNILPKNRLLKLRCAIRIIPSLESEFR